MSLSEYQATTVTDETLLRDNESLRNELQIHKDKYKGNCIFSDLDVLPVHYFEDVLQGIRLSLPPNQGVNVDYTGNRDTATSFVYMGYAGNVHEVLWVNEEETPQYEWNFKPLTELPSTGTMALQRAAENGHKEIVKLLLKKQNISSHIIDSEILLSKTIT